LSKFPEIHRDIAIIVRSFCTGVGNQDTIESSPENCSRTLKYLMFIRGREFHRTEKHCVILDLAAFFTHSYR